MVVFRPVGASPSYVYFNQEATVQNSMDVTAGGVEGGLMG